MSPSPVIDVTEVAVRPEPGDNVAIVSRDLDPGTRLRIGEDVVALPHRLLEGHRVVVEPVSAGGDLLSWSTPFARARHDLRPGDCICTPSSLAALRERGVTGLPDEPTAENVSLDPYELDESTLHVGEQVEPAPQPRTFLGYARARGAAGTRNHVVVVGATSRSSAFVTELARRLARDAPAGFDGVVPVAHTEAGEDHRPNNLDYVLATLAGFLLNPNVGAVLLVDEAGDVVTAADVAAFMREHDYPDVAVPHASFTRRARLRGRPGGGRRARRAVDPGGGRPAAHRAAAGRPADRHAVRRLRRLLGHQREPAVRGAVGRSGAARRHRGALGDRRADRRRGLRAGERPHRRGRPRLPAQDGGLQGAGQLARRHRRGQPVRRQRLPRPLQHRAEVGRRRPQARPPDAARRRAGLRAAVAPATASCSWTAPATTSSRSPARSPPAAT